MSEPIDLWSEVERRAMLSGVAGISSGDDDVVGGAELGEAAINPGRAGSKPNKDSGTGMMPPMMGGGRGGTGAGAGATGAPGGGPTPVVLDMGGMSGINAANSASAIRSVAAAPASSMGSVGALPGAGTMPSAGVSAAGAAPMPGTGIMAASTVPDDANGDGFADLTAGSGGRDLNGDGIIDVDAKGNPIGMGAGSSAGGLTGPRTDPGPARSDGDPAAPVDPLDTGGGSGVPDPIDPTGGGTSNASSLPSGGVTPQFSSPAGSAGVSTAASSSTSSATSRGTSTASTGGGYSVETSALRSRANDWAGLSSDMDSILAEASSMQAEFGTVSFAQSSHDQLTAAAKSWSSAAGAGAADMRSKLSTVASAFDERESLNTQTSKQVM